MMKKRPEGQQRVQLAKSKPLEESKNIDDNDNASVHDSDEEDFAPKSVKAHTPAPSSSKKVVKRVKKVVRKTGDSTDE